MLVYVDSSVLARGYLRDEVGHDQAREMIEGAAFLVTSTLTVLEVTSALVRASSAGRTVNLDVLLSRLHFEISPDGPVTVIGGDQMLTETMARQIVREHGLRTLDALHLAVADLSARPLAGDDQDVAFASRDDAQRAVAEQLGFTTV